MMKIIAGTRGSKLAMVQTQSIADALDCEVELKRISTRGDNIQDVALARIEGKGFFTKEIDDALLNKEIDFAVHSMKDVPTELPDGIIIAAIPERESKCDALVGQYSTLESLPRYAKVGTSSLRRKAGILRIRQDADILELRGNVDTRMGKLKDGMYDAIVVAEAGLKRLGYSDYHPLDPESFIPAAGQGALAITARKDDTEILDIISKLDDPLTRMACECERLFLSTLEGGCQVPAGVNTDPNTKDNLFRIKGFISSLDGKQYLMGEINGGLEEAKDITLSLANKLLNSGGDVILKEIRKEMI